MIYRPGTSWIIWSLVGLLNGKMESGRLKDRVVILGYDGAKIHTVPTPLGRIRAHRLFYYGLVSIMRRFEERQCQ